VDDDSGTRPGSDGHEPDGSGEARARDAARRRPDRTQVPVPDRRTAHHQPDHTGPAPRRGADRPDRLVQWEQRTEIPLAVAALVFLAAYAVRVLARHLPEAVLDLCLAVILAAWALFAVDYAVRWYLSGQRLRFVRTHLLDTAVLLLPLLRPLRIVKVYEAVQRRHGRPRLALHARVIAYSGLSTFLLGFAGALAVYQQERDAPGTTMPTFGPAVWWTCATLTTVGYGDVTPVTPMGRLIAVGVMVIGLALLAAVTGTFASWLLQVFAREDDERPPGS
jgi:voltage-gated potassium channel